MRFLTPYFDRIVFPPSHLFSEGETSVVEATSVSISSTNSDFSAEAVWGGGKKHPPEGNQFLPERRNGGVLEEEEAV